MFFDLQLRPHLFHVSNLLTTYEMQEQEQKQKQKEEQ